MKFLKAVIAGQIEAEHPEDFRIIVGAAKKCLGSITAAGTCPDLLPQPYPQAVNLCRFDYACSPYGLDRIVKAMRKRDFLLAIQSSNAQSNSLMMRVGMARALGIPIFLAIRSHVTDTSISTMAEYVMSWKTINDLERGIDMTKVGDAMEALFEHSREPIPA